ncbi:hypothetical protein IFR05_014510 [Cadophora sp. M221]|nr:hypothetical protein IFR05_014510 [Cadophora sp. M221]
MPYVCLPCRRLLKSPYYECWLRRLSPKILQDAASGVNPRKSLLVDTPLPIASHQRQLQPQTKSSSSPQRQRQAAAVKPSPPSYREIIKQSSAGPSRTYIEIKGNTVESNEESRPNRAISIINNGKTPLAAAPPLATSEPWCPAGCGTRLSAVQAQDFREFDSSEYTLPHIVQCPRPTGRLKRGRGVRIGTGNPLAEKLPGMHPDFRRAHVFVIVPVWEGGPQRRMRKHFLLDEDPGQRISMPLNVPALVSTPQWVILSPPFAQAPVNIIWNLIIKYAFIGDKSPLGHAKVEAKLYQSLGLGEKEFIKIKEIIEVVKVNN